ncbi:hypothetical protein BZG36_03298 [Bifiguratus adelaidae]|uniref:Uncharacterized protein n=1 Tax=Bifiguratus adelaidae TaxID=1938954 RepID=A0A261XZB0_9FUNG|nr:hypothetical protein BZG36_03298 [Bifiguratus adelaidae]
MESIHALQKTILLQAKVRHQWDKAQVTFRQLEEAIQSRSTLTQKEVQCIQTAFMLMVRYAPTVLEATLYYRHLLSHYTTPIRTDECIDHCLISLIFAYSRTRDNDYLNAGLALLQMALDRGLAHGKQGEILRSVSTSILESHQCRISPDGTRLEPSNPDPKPTSQRKPRSKITSASEANTSSPRSAKQPSTSKEPVLTSSSKFSKPSFLPSAESESVLELDYQQLSSEDMVSHMASLSLGNARRNPIKTRKAKPNARP